MLEADLLQRIRELLQKHGAPGGDPPHGIAHELLASALNIATSVYGSGSPQEEDLRRIGRALTKSSTPSPFGVLNSIDSIKGSLSAMEGDLSAGVTRKLRSAIAGEVFGDLLASAKEALAEDKDRGIKVAAVLVAAAGEDALRRLGSARAGIQDRRQLSEIVIALKEKDVLVGATVGFTQDFLGFRNDALHADWKRITRPAVEIAMRTVEQILSAHF